MRSFSKILANGKNGHVISLPQEFVKSAGIKPGSRIDERIEGDKIILSKSRKGRKSSYSVFQHNGKYFRAFISAEWIRSRGLAPKDRVSIEIIKSPAIELVLF